MYSFPDLGEVSFRSPHPVRITAIARFLFAADKAREVVKPTMSGTGARSRSSEQRRWQRKLSMHNSSELYKKKEQNEDDSSLTVDALDSRLGGIAPTSKGFSKSSPNRHRRKRESVMPLGEYANFKGGSPSKELFMTGSGKGKMSSVQPGTKEMRDLETILHRCLKRIFFSDPSLCSNEDLCSFLIGACS